MKAGIIAAGEGSRLRSEGIGLPKPLVPVDGTPLIERLIRTFIRHGITEIACIVNEYSLDVKRFVEECRFPVKISFVVKTTPSSMHSLFALAPLLKNERFLLSTVDTVFREDEFASYLQFAGARESVDGILAITNFIDDENPLYVQLDAVRRIQSFSKSDSSEWITGGLYVFSPKVFDEMDSVLKKRIERLRNFLSHLIERGYSIEGFPFSKMIDIDHVHDIDTARTWIAEENLKSQNSTHHRGGTIKVR
jgi:NDP-sugar pyrophosphorylase family protein